MLFVHTPRRSARRVATAAVLAIVAGFGALHGTATASTGSQTFSYTGAAQTWTVPPGVNSINVDVQGAQGTDNAPGFGTALGGRGGRVQATVRVTPDDSIGVYVGGVDRTGNGGFNGGGGFATLGGGGGGGSDIRVGGPTIFNRVVVAGGGGGAGRNGAQGGNGGGLTGQSGGSSEYCCAGGGEGGSQTAGGAGGQGHLDTRITPVVRIGPPIPGSPGRFFDGGSPGYSATLGVDQPPWIIPNLFLQAAEGGGGGGGWFGGGGGAFNAGSGGGGGGGSSYAESTPTTNVLHTPGYRSGDGVITVSWDTSMPTPTPLATIPPAPSVSPIPSPTVPPTSTLPPTPTLSPTPTISTTPSGYPSDDCDAAGSNVITGFLDGAYAKSKTAPGGANATWLCLAGEVAGAHVGGKLTLNASAPGLSVASVDLDNASIDACATNANNQHINGGQIAGQPWFINYTPSPAGSTDSAWVCVRMTNSVGFRLRFAPGISVGLPSFTPDSTSPHLPAYVADPPGAPTQPSAACQLAGGTRFANLTVGSTPVNLYSWQESASKAHLCVRAGASGGAGAQLTVDTGGVSTGITTSNNTSACPFPLFTSDNPSLGAYTSNPSASLPVSACVAVGSTALGVTVNAPTTGQVVAVQQDTA